MASTLAMPADDDGDLSWSSPSSYLLEPLVYLPKGDHTHTFIFLHGRGDTARNFGPHFMQAEHSSGKLLGDLLPNVKFIFPTAKRRRLAAQNRCTISQWFDIVSLKDTSEREEVQIEGLRESSDLIHRIIRSEIQNIPCSNIILGGLSQGCATALYALLTFEPTGLISSESQSSIGAMIGMSGWLPFCKHIDSLMNQSETGSEEDDQFDRTHGPVLTHRCSRELSTLNYLRENIDLPPLTSQLPTTLHTPVFLGHGTADAKVDVSLGENATASLESLGMDVTWMPYQNFHHWYKEPDEIDDIVLFLQRKINLAVA